MWVLLPGLLGQASDLDSLIPESDSIMHIDYIHKIGGDYNGRICALRDVIRQRASHTDIVGLGYSMGGRLLYSLSQCDPTLFKKSIFISSGFPLSGPKDRYKKQCFETLAQNQLSRVTPREFLHWWYTLPIYSTLKKHQDFDHLITKKTESFDPIIIKHLLGAFSSLHMPILSKKINCPSLYFAGEMDKKYQSMKQLLPKYFENAQFCSVPESSHLCHWEASPFLKHTIAKWIHPTRH